MDVSDGCLRLAIPTVNASATRRFEATFVLRTTRAFALCSEVLR
jgi:hypothetical protein